MAAPLLALPFLSNHLVLGALAVIGVGAYLYSNKQDSLVVQADGLYSEILGFFISFSKQDPKGNWRAFGQCYPTFWYGLRSAFDPFILLQALSKQ